MLEWIGPLITAIKTAGPKLITAIFVASSLLLFSPASFIERIGLAQFTLNYRPYLGGLSMVSASLVAVNAAAWVAHLARLRWNKWQIRRDDIRKLNSLTRGEKDFLKPYILEDKTTRYLPLFDGVASSLEAKQLVYRASSLSTPGQDFPYNLQPPIRLILRERPDVLG